MGLGLALIVSPYYADKIQAMLAAAGHENWKIGSVSSAKQSSVELTNAV